MFSDISEGIEYDGTTGQLFMYGSMDTDKTGVQDCAIETDKNEGTGLMGSLARSFSAPPRQHGGFKAPRHVPYYEYGNVLHGVLG